MDYKKSKAPVNTVTRNIMDLCEDTGNIYESVPNGLRVAERPVGSGCIMTR